jgi:hypothetical protein
MSVGGCINIELNKFNNIKCIYNMQIKIEYFRNKPIIKQCINSSTTNASSTLDVGGTSIATNKHTFLFIEMVNKAGNLCWGMAGIVYCYNLYIVEWS